MKQFFDVMIDTETMGKNPDAAVVSIGAVFFDLQTCTLGPTFLQTIHLGSAVAHGGTMDAGTVLWWLRQPEEARHGVCFGGRAIDVVLGEFAAWIVQTCRLSDARPWGNSDFFDIPKVESAYTRLGMTVPWYWTNVRDFRTVRNLNPQVAYDPKAKGDGAHNALVDAQFQAEHLFAIKRSKQRA